MDLLFKTRNIKFVVAILPDEFQVEKNLQKAIFDRFNLEESDYDLDLAQNLLKSFLDAKGISYVDLTERFKAEGQSKQLYLFRDTHWNDGGNQLAADILCQKLLADPALPQK